MIKVALGQIAPVTADKEANFEKMKKLTIEAAEQGAHLVIFPELALSGYNCGDQFFSIAESIPGESTKKFETVAKEYDIHIIWGMPEESISGVLYNAAALVGPAGFIGKWRKNTLPGHATDTMGPGAFPDRRFFKNGDEVAVYDTPIGKIGLLICYDIFFPELARLITLQGADLIVGISGSPSFEKDIFEPIVKVRAMENTVNIAYTNLVGNEGQTEYWGGGFIVGAGDTKSKVPGNPIICKAPYEGECITIGEVDLDANRKIRPYFPILRDLKTSMYEQLAKAHKNLT